MTPIEITILVICILIVGGNIARFIYKKVKHLPTGECACCSKAKKKSNLLEMYRKDNPKTN